MFYLHTWSSYMGLDRASGTGWRRQDGRRAPPRPRGRAPLDRPTNCFASFVSNATGATVNLTA